MRYRFNLKNIAGIKSVKDASTKFVKAEEVKMLKVYIRVALARLALVLIHRASPL